MSVTDSMTGTFVLLLVMLLLIGVVVAVVFFVMFIFSWHSTFVYLRKKHPERWKSMSWFSGGVPIPNMSKQERQMKFLFSTEDNDPVLGNLKRSLRIYLVLLAVTIAVDTGIVVVVSVVAFAYNAVNMF